jgi:hypothetical protein
VLQLSPNVEGTEAGEWDWEALSSGPSLREAGAGAMALDVLAFARSRGWTKRQRGELAAKPWRAAT